MDFVFLPYKAFVLCVILLGALIGTIYLRKTSKLLGMLSGGTVAAILVVFVSAVMPVKLTTNKESFHKVVDSKAYKRQTTEIPAKVTNEVTSYDESLRKIEADLTSKQ